MAKSIGILNYLGFLLLYIICFIFLFKNYSEYIGFTVLLILNIASLLYVTNDVMKILEESYFFVQMFTCLSIIVGLTFTTVVIIFILMISNNIHSKYLKLYGKYLDFPKKYRRIIDELKKFIVASLSLVGVLLYILFYYNDSLNVDLTMLLSYFKLKFLNDKKLLFFTLALSIVLITISSYEVYLGNSLLMLSKQPIMDIPK